MPTPCNFLAYKSFNFSSKFSFSPFSILPHLKQIQTQKLLPPFLEKKVLPRDGYSV